MSMRYQNSISTTAITIWTPAFVGDNTNHYHSDNIPILLSSSSSSSATSSTTPMSPCRSDRLSFRLPNLLVKDPVVSNSSNSNNSNNEHCYHYRYHHYQQQQRQRNIGIVLGLRKQKCLRGDQHQQQQTQCSRKEQIMNARLGLTNSFSFCIHSFFYDGKSSDNDRSMN